MKLQEIFRLYNIGKIIFSARKRAANVMAFSCNADNLHELMNRKLNDYMAKH